MIFRISLSLLFFFFSMVSGFAQDLRVLSGYVRDASSGESLLGAVVKVEGMEASVQTNSYGFYSLRLPAQRHKLQVSFVGYQIAAVDVDLRSNQSVNVELIPQGATLEAVEVSAERKDRNVRDAAMGLHRLGTEEVKNLPVIFGEKDLLKTIQLLPGVQSGGEGSSNFYVRGGAGDQNLILLDEATVYNASHLLGFFSTFNSDAIKDIQLYKGGVPAQYGGRISSVLDITMLEGNQKQTVVEGGVGLIASRLKVEGPIVRDKGSFAISGRRTYADMFLKLSDDKNINSSKLYFYDLNAKANYRFNEKNTLYLSGYLGKDELSYSDKFGFDWGNKTLTARWNWIMNQRLFSNTTAIYSDFQYNVGVYSDDNDFKIRSKIRNWNLKQDFSYYHAAQSTFRFGANILQQSIFPTSLEAAPGSSINTTEMQTMRGLDVAAYVSHEWKPSSRLALVYGLRLNDYMVMGPGNFYSYDGKGDVVETRTYGSEIIKHYLNLEPRLSASYMLNGSSSLKASYNRIAQNLHQLTNTTASLPTDQYVSSSLNIKPQLADQVALGYFRNFANDSYEFSVEAYYKKMGNQIDFRNGADLQANEFLEGDLLFGEGRAYGLEWLVKKSRGRFTGWLSYTLSKSERQFDEINAGQWFRARQDRTHDISLVGMYQLSDSWALGATWVYYSGNAVTFPSGKYEMDGKSRFYYAERNGYRMPSYHRLDISATYEPVTKRKRFTSSWTFGVYNAYNRKNAYIIDFRENEENRNKTEAYQVALFGAIPSVTWNFKF